MHLSPTQGRQGHSRNARRPSACSRRTPLSFPTPRMPFVIRRGVLRRLSGDARASRRVRDRGTGCSGASRRPSQARGGIPFGAVPGRDNPGRVGRRRSADPARPSGSPTLRFTQGRNEISSGPPCRRCVCVCRSRCGPRKVDSGNGSNSRYSRGPAIRRCRSRLYPDRGYKEGAFPRRV